MKQAIIGDDGMTVANVIVVSDDFEGLLVLTDDVYVGPGMLWDQSPDDPHFVYPADLSGEAPGLWDKIKGLFV